ncbi:MAG TPA: tetratricopeptide repeat protein [Thermoanaerobaculia bacterium]|nr:tetratricopeptide repeat protein [Thermoanaerobaculia bacterium]
MTARSLALTLLLAVGSGGCASSSDPATLQERFGVRMAKMNLWREAMFRFQRAVEMNPENAMAHNNLAVALEANGDFDGAGEAYREAMRLDRSNEYIQKNYSRFVEFTTRERRRQQERRPATRTAASTPATSSVAEQPAEPADAEPVEVAPGDAGPEPAPSEQPPPPAPPNPPGGSS